MSKRTGRPVGRPSKWTKETRQSIIANTRALGLRHLAANLAGVGESTLYAWLAAADAPNPSAEFVEFREELEKARAEYIARKWARIGKAAADPRHWAADMTQLERMDPEHFGRRERVEVTGKDGAPLEIEIKWDAATP